MNGFVEVIFQNYPYFQWTLSKSLSQGPSSLVCHGLPKLSGIQAFFSNIQSNLFMLQWQKNAYIIYIYFFALCLRAVYKENPFWSFQQLFRLCDRPKVTNQTSYFELYWPLWSCLNTNYSTMLPLISILPAWNWKTVDWIKIYKELVAERFKLVYSRLWNHSLNDRFIALSKAVMFSVFSWYTNLYGLLYSF